MLRLVLAIRCLAVSSFQIIYHDVSPLVFAAAPIRGPLFASYHNYSIFSLLFLLSSLLFPLISPLSYPLSSYLPPFFFLRWLLIRAVERILNLGLASAPKRRLRK